MKRFLLEMFNGNKEVSSKRVNGTLCILSVIFILTISIIFDKSISSELVKLLKIVFWGGTALLGLGITEKYIK